VAPIPIFLESADLSAITPIDDIRSTARYRLQVAKNLMAEFLSIP